MRKFILAGAAALMLSGCEAPKSTKYEITVDGQRAEAYVYFLKGRVDRYGADFLDENYPIAWTASNVWGRNDSNNNGIPDIERMMIVCKTKRPILFEENGTVYKKSDSSWAPMSNTICDLPGNAQAVADETEEAVKQAVNNTTKK